MSNIPTNPMNFYIPPLQIDDGNKKNFEALYALFQKYKNDQMNLQYPKQYPSTSAGSIPSLMKPLGIPPLQYNPPSIPEFYQPRPIYENNQLLNSNLNYNNDNTFEIYSEQPIPPFVPQLIEQKANFQIPDLISQTSFDSPRKTKRRNPRPKKSGQPKVNRKVWLPEDDETLLKLAIQYKNDWKKIAKRIHNLIKKKRPPNFLKNRYKLMTESKYKKRVKFSHKEDLEISKYFRLHNGDWMEISRHFPDRTAIMVKNRYYSHIHKRNLLEDLLKEVDSGVLESGNFSEDFETLNESDKNIKNNLDGDEKSLQQTYFDMNMESPDDELHDHCTYEEGDSAIDCHDKDEDDDSDDEIIYQPEDDNQLSDHEGDENERKLENL